MIAKGAKLVRETMQLTNLHLRFCLVRVAMACMTLMALCAPTLAQGFPTLPGTFELVYKVTSTDVTPPIVLKYFQQEVPSLATVRLPTQQWTATLVGNSEKLALVENNSGNRVFLWDGESTTEIDLPSADLTPTNMSSVTVYPGASAFLRQFIPISSTSLAPSISLLRNVVWTDKTGEHVAAIAPVIGGEPPRGPMIYHDAACTLERTSDGLAASSCTIVGRPNPRTNSVTLQVWSYSQYGSFDGVPIAARASVTDYGSIEEVRGKPLPYIPGSSELLSAYQAGNTATVGVPYLKYDFALVKVSKDTWPEAAFSTSYWLRPGGQVSDLRNKNTPSSFAFQVGKGDIAEQALQQACLNSTNPRSPRRVQ
jgi:hypothetical protein